jgi:hypothetical protein
MAEGRIIAAYETDKELKAILQWLVEDLNAKCLRDVGFLQFDGFFIRAPQGEDWLIDTSQAGHGIPIVFTKKHDPGAMGAGEAHTVVAMVLVERIKLPVGNRDELLQHLIQSFEKQLRDSPRYKLISLKTSEDRSLNADCVRYTVTAEDRAVPGFPGAVFVLGVRGFRCIQPDRLAPLSLPSLVVDVGYSQRFRNGQWIEAFDPEAEPFLKSLAFTYVEPRPYVIASLENYASLLQQMNRDGEAKEVRAQADKLREAHGEYGSTVLGFNPSAILQEYAALLRARNREAEAKEVEALADARERSQIGHFMRLQQTK